jgi:hypothetical protein
MTEPLPAAAHLAEAAAAGIACNQQAERDGEQQAIHRGGPSFPVVSSCGGPSHGTLPRRGKPCLSGIDGTTGKVEQIHPD